MGCFSGQKPKRRLGDSTAKVEQADCSAERVLSAPPSFKSRVRAIQNAQRFVNGNPKLRYSHPSYGSRDCRDASPSPTLGFAGRARSVTELRSSISDVATEGSLLSMEEKKTPSPQPLPLPFPKFNAYRLPQPSPTSSPGISPSPSGKQAPYLNSASNGEDPLPLPPPSETLAGLKCFSHDQLATFYQNFSHDLCVGDADMRIIRGGLRAVKEEVTVMRVCERWQQRYKEWVAELSTVARLQNPHLCKLVGLCADEGIAERFLVYEKLQKGSLDGLLFGGSDSPPLDWPTRVKIAFGAAQGLSCLHETFPEQVMFRQCRSNDIQVGGDYSSKLSGYRFIRETFSASTDPRADAYCAPETLSAGEISWRSNIWSFGIVLLELLTGRQNMDQRIAKEERNLVKWTKPFLMDESRLFLIMDPKLQGRFPSKGAKIIADLALQCLQNDPIKRPSMKKVTDTVKSVQEMRYTIRFPLKEPPDALNLPSPAASSPSQLPHPVLASSRSLRGILKPNNFREIERPYNYPKFDLIQGPRLKPLIIPPRSCATSFAMDEAHHQYYSSAPLERVTGF